MTNNCGVRQIFHEEKIIGNKTGRAKEPTTSRKSSRRISPNHAVKPRLINIWTSESTNFTLTFAQFFVGCKQLKSQGLQNNPRNLSVVAKSAKLPLDGISSEARNPQVRGGSLVELLAVVGPGRPLD